MTVSDLLRQRQHLADIMDSPTIRLGRELQERNRLFQAYENPLSQFRLQAPLTGLSRDSNRLRQALIDNVRQATQLPETLSVAMNQSLKNAELAGSAIVRSAELAAVTKQISERISLSATVVVRSAAATRSRIEITDPLSSFQRQLQRAMAEPLRQAELLQQSVRSNFLPLHNALTDSAAAMIRLAEGTRIASVSRLQRQFQRIIQDHFRQAEQLRKTLSVNFSSLHNSRAESIIAATRRSIGITDPLSGFQRQLQRAMAEPLRQTEQLQKTLSVNIVASVSSLQRQHQRIIQDHFRQVEQLRKALSVNFSSLYNSHAESIIAATRRSIGITDPLSGFQRQLQRAMADSLRQTEQLQKALRLRLLPATALSSQLHDILQAKTSLAALDPTFAGGMQAWLNDGEATTSEPEREEFLAYLFGWLIEKFHQLPQGIISLEMFNTLLTIGLFMYSTWSNSQMESRLMESRLMEKFTVCASEKQIVCKMEEVRPSPIYRNRYVVAVTDRLRLREEPSPAAPILGFLLPNTLVKEIEQHESWSLIEFSDYTDGSVKKGWVYRDYLRAIQPEKS